MTSRTQSSQPLLSPEALELLSDRPAAVLPPRDRRLRLLEDALGQLDRGAPIREVRLGQMLAPMMRGGHKHLSYVTPSVFCREELGLCGTAAWDLVRLAEGLLRRPVLRAAFLEGKLPPSHVIELLRLDPTGDAEWATRSQGLPVRELRKAIQPLRPVREVTEGEPRRVRVYELDGEAYATWLAGVELARRREGRDLDGGPVLEQVVAEFFAGTGAPPVQPVPWEFPAPQPEAPPFQKNPQFEAKQVPEPRPDDRKPDEPGPEPDFPALLAEPVPNSPRKLVRLARRLLAEREQAELLRGRLLRRVQEGRLYRDAGFPRFRDWLRGRGIAASTAFQCTARDKKLDGHQELRSALLDGRLTPTKADHLLRLPKRAETVSWIAYAESRTCRRLEEAVDAALLMAARFPAAWGTRRGTPPGDEEAMQDFRDQAGLATLEAALDDLAAAFGAVATSEAPEVQTSAPPAGAVAISEVPEVQTSAAPAGTVRLRVSVPEPVDRLFRAAEAELSRDAGRKLAPEECLHVLLLVFLKQVGLDEMTAMRRLRRQALERAGFRCEVPGCTCRTNLHAHHLEHRSRGGSDDLRNLCILCSSHHLRHAHLDCTFRAEGEDPETRIWELGVDGTGEPWRIYLDERLLDGAALAEEPDRDAPPLDDRVCERSPAYGGQAAPAARDARPTWPSRWPPEQVA